MDQLRVMLNEFHSNIPAHLQQPIRDAIDAAEASREVNVIASLSMLMTLLYNGYDATQAVNLYMTRDATRYSATRTFFYEHTLPGNLRPEDQVQVPPAPTGLPPLMRCRSEWDTFAVASDQGLMAFSGQIAVRDLFPEVSAAPSNEELMVALGVSNGDDTLSSRNLFEPARVSGSAPRIDTYFTREVQEQLHEDVVQDPTRAQAPSAIPRQ